MIHRNKLNNNFSFVQKNVIFCTEHCFLLYKRMHSSVQENKNVTN